MNIGLLIVGDEILSGKRADKHLPKVIELLAARGLALALGALCRRRPGAHHRRPARRFAERRHRLFAAAASARRPTTTRGSARRPRSACRWRCIRRRATWSSSACRTSRASRACRSSPTATTTGTASTWPCSRRAPRSSRTRTTRSPASRSARRRRGGVFFVPGFPVMAWPMIEWVLDTHYRHLHVARGDAASAR